MKTATVIGKVWASKRLSELPSGALLQLRVDASQEELVALDPLGCGEGEQVLVSQGEMVAQWAGQNRCVVDALIVGVIDGKT